jgi:hypothetical protein
MISKYPDRNLAWTVIFSVSERYTGVHATNDAGQQLHLAFDKDGLFTMPVLAKDDTVCFVCTSGALTLLFDEEALLGTKVLSGGETKAVIYGDAVPRIFRATCVIVNNETGMPAVWGASFPVPR